MKVAYIGYPKTGTKTLAAALKILGYEVYDYSENFLYLESEWKKILTSGGSVEDFQSMYKDVDSTVDTPIFIYWQEILKAFPRVKFVICIRDEEKWLQSWNNQIKKIQENNQAKLYYMLSPIAQRFARFSRLCSRVCFGGIEHTWPWNSYIGFNNLSMLKKYRQHNLEVITKAPKDQLLVYNLEDGWAPLCNFLGKEIPQHEFPFENKSGTVLETNIKEGEIFKRARKEVLVVLIVVALPLLLIVLCAVYF